MSLPKEVIEEIVRICDSVPEEDLEEFAQLIEHMKVLLMVKRRARRGRAKIRTPFVLVDDNHPLAQGKSGVVIDTADMPVAKAYLNDILKNYIREQKRPVPDNFNDMITRLEEITANGQKNYTREARELMTHIKLKAFDGKYMVASEEMLPEDEIRIRGRKYIVTSEYVRQINDRAVDTLYRPSLHL